MPQKIYRLTPVGKAKLEAELEDKRVNKRQELDERIKVARSYGDLSENAEYDSARRDNEKNERRISELENILANVEIIEALRVKAVRLEDNVEIDIEIVGSQESELVENKISDESPIGKAFKGAKEGDVVTVEAPGGSFEYKITKIAKEKN